MTDTPDDFDGAIKQALRSASIYKTALRDVMNLVRDLSQSVSREMDGAVRIELREKLLGAGIADLLAVVSDDHAMASDREAKNVRHLVVAYGRRRGASRTLWLIDYGRGGYPLKIVGPADDDVITVFAADELRTAFLALASDLVVGRKLAGLAADSAELEKDATAALPTGDSNDASNDGPAQVVEDEVDDDIVDAEFDDGPDGGGVE